MLADESPAVLQELAALEVLAVLDTPKQHVIVAAGQLLVDRSSLADPEFFFADHKVVIDAELTTVVAELTTVVADLITVVAEDAIDYEEHFDGVLYPGYAGGHCSW